MFVYRYIGTNICIIVCIHIVIQHTRWFICSIGHRVLSFILIFIPFKECPMLKQTYFFQIKITFFYLKLYSRLYLKKLMFNKYLN